MKKLLIALLFCAGCQQPIVIHPIEQHVYYVPAGIELKTVNHGTIITKYPGVWFSDFYADQLWEVEKEQARE